jgi:ABC-type cobalamin/Fe3+-siderophores transport system ATPase subunit
LDNVTFRYSDSQDILKGVSLEIPEGKVTVLLGPNGSGKTTLFKVLLNLVTPQSGDIILNGEIMHEFSRNNLSKVMAWVPQDEEPTFPYTVMEYLHMGRTPYLGFFEMPSEEDTEKIVQLLEDLGISHLKDREISKLSGGEKRLALLARALAQEPELLILDEPTAHLDLGNKVMTLKALRDMAESGRTVLFSSHDPNEALLVGDHVSIISEGEIMGQGAPAETVTEEILKTIYGTDIRVIEVDGRLSVDLPEVARSS